MIYQSWPSFLKWWWWSSIRFLRRFLMILFPFFCPPIHFKYITSNPTSIGTCLRWFQVIWRERNEYIHPECFRREVWTFRKWERKCRRKLKSLVLNEWVTITRLCNWLVFIIDPCSIYFVACKDMEVKTHRRKVTLCHLIKAMPSQQHYFNFIH